MCVCVQGVGVFLLQSPEMKLVAFLLQFILDEKHLPVTLWKRLRIRSVISVNYHYITVLCPFNVLIRFNCYNTV